MIKFNKERISRRLSRVKLVKFSDDDINYNNTNNRMVRANFDSYAVGYIVGSEHKIFVDAYADNHEMCEYYETLAEAVEAINTRYIDAGEIFAVHQEPLEEACNIRTKDLRIIKSKLRKSDLFYNFEKK